MVTETTENRKEPFNGTAVTGAALGGAALLVQLLGGAFGGIFGGNRPPAGDPPWARDLTYERELTVANAKIGQLGAEKYADGVTLAAERRLADKIEALEARVVASNQTQAVLNAKQEAFIATLAGQVSSFDRLTQRFINPGVMVGSEAIAASFKAGAAAATEANG